MKKQLLILLFCLFSLPVFAQTDTLPAKPQYDPLKTYRFELLDGSVLMGQILKYDSTTFYLKTSYSPQIEILAKNMKTFKEIAPENLMGGIYKIDNPNYTRYLFGPSAFNLKAGEGYYQNTYLLLNSANVGLTDYLSVGGGIELLSTFALGNPIFFITPKVGFKVSKNLHAGGGVLYANVPSFDDDESRTGLGISYGLVTYGNTDNNITGGIGYGFIKGEFSNKPVFTINATTRIANRASLVTENWLYPDQAYQRYYSYGIRFFGERISVDLAFINNAEIAKAILIGIPYIDFVVKFD